VTKVPQPSLITTRKLSVAQQISKLMTLLQKLPPDKATEALFIEICGWITDLPPASRPEALSSAIAQAFNKPIEEIDLVLKPTDKRVEFDANVPKRGWIHDYVEWTRNTEPPTVFHFFVAATIIGSALGRNVFFDKGAYQVYPNLCVVIVAPTGRCRKTSACNLGTGLLMKVGGTVLADKTTPEALVDALKTKVNATGLIYAPELAVFLGKQKYQEGMVPLLTALFDCPKDWVSKTIGRGDTSLSNVALSALMCSTIDWIQTGISKDAFGGGFMSRFLFVVQEATSRTFPLPPKLNAEIKSSLVTRLLVLTKLKGEYVFSDPARDWYSAWYRSRAAAHGDKQYAGYFERKPDHIIRIAMILKAAEDPTNFTISIEDLVAAEKILRWLEIWLPSTFEEMTSNAVGEDQTRILRQLRQMGGAAEHTSLLRKNSSRMNAFGFKNAMSTLREARLVEWDGAGKKYFLTSEGWK
jgi:hypothetical protein